MFDIGATELLLVIVVAILVIGPKDMPLALRTVGKWVGKFRKMSAQFRSGFDNIVREAELEEMEQKWKAQNEKIMREHPEGVPAEMEPTGAYPPPQLPSGKAAELRKMAGEGDEQGIIAAKEEHAIIEAKDAAAAAASGGDAPAANAESKIDASAKQKAAEPAKPSDPAKEA